MRSAAEPPGGEEVTDPPWDAWTPRELALLLRGGWALDLYLGRLTRPHEDLEMAVPAGDFGAVRDALSGFELDVIGSGRRWPLGSPGADAALTTHHQTWVRDVDGTYRVDVFREPHDGGTWICRRDEAIRLPYSEIIERTADGVPFLAPEIVLLFKAKALRDKDQDDFERVLPELSPVRRAWLRLALQQVHPGHRWVEPLHS